MVSTAQAGVMSKIQQYEAKFKELKEWFTHYQAIEIDITLLRCLKKIENIESDGKRALVPSRNVRLIPS